MIIVGLDFETKSRVDLKACGADIYASDPSTDILMCSFINKDNGQQWLWYAGEKIPADLVMALNLATEVEAHNARFDQLIYEYIAAPDYGFPLIPKEKWVCTAAQCRVNALPASLDAATRAASTTHKKDHSGSALIRKLCIPNKKTGEFNNDPKLMKDMGYGDGYNYDHDTEHGFSGQNYFPDGMARQTFYAPKGRGREKAIKERLEHWAALRSDLS